MGGRTLTLMLLLGAAMASPGAALEGSEPAVLSREQWGARPAGPGMVGHRPQRITIHHTGSPANRRRALGAKLVALQAFSQSRAPLADGRIKAAWPDFPYHYYIEVAGGVAQGREAAFVGDTNTAYDPTGHIGVVLEGNFDHETPTPGQTESLTRLLVALVRRHAIPPDRIGVHRQFARTACPGRNLEAALPAIRAAVARALDAG